MKLINLLVFSFILICAFCEDDVKLKCSNCTDCTCKDEICTCKCTNCTKATNEQEPTETVYYVFENPDEYVLEPVYYTSTPVYYTSTSQNIEPVCQTIEKYYSPNDAVIDVYYRKASERNFNGSDFEQAKRIVEDQKKKMFGDANYSMESLRKNNSIYDRKWLEAQYRISKLLYLEDQLKQKE